MRLLFHAKAQSCERRHKESSLRLRVYLCAFVRNCFFLLAFAVVGNAQIKPSDYSRTEAMIPMRDGVRLYTQIDAPTTSTQPLPALLLRQSHGGTSRAGPDRTFRGRLHSRTPGHSRALQVGRRVCHAPPAARS